MTGSGKSLRDSLAGKNLIGFTKDTERGSPTVQRASTAKVGPVKDPKQSVDGTKPASASRT